MLSDVFLHLLSCRHGKVPTSMPTTKIACSSRFGLFITQMPMKALNKTMQVWSYYCDRKKHDSEPNRTAPNPGHAYCCSDMLSQSLPSSETCLVPIHKRCRVQRTGNQHMLNKHTCTFASSMSVVVEAGAPAEHRFLLLSRGPPLFLA